MSIREQLKKEMDQEEIKELEEENANNSECNKMDDFDKKFSEIEEVIKEGEKENFEKDMLELLKFEEAGFKIKWASYSRKQALKLRSRA